MNPKNKDDFDLLFHALEKWRLEELAVINATMTGMSHVVVVVGGGGVGVIVSSIVSSISSIVSIVSSIASSPPSTKKSWG